MTGQWQSGAWSPLAPRTVTSRGSCPNAPCGRTDVTMWSAPTSSAAHGITTNAFPRTPLLVVPRIVSAAIGAVSRADVGGVIRVGKGRTIASALTPCRRTDKPNGHHVSPTAYLSISWAAAEPRHACGSRRGTAGVGRSRDGDDGAERRQAVVHRQTVDTPPIKPWGDTAGDRSGADGLGQEGIPCRRARGRAHPPSPLRTHVARGTISVSDTARWHDGWRGGRSRGRSVDTRDALVGG